MTVSIALTAGCGWTEPPCPHKIHKTVVTKIGEDGSLEWSKNYENLISSSSSYIVQNSKGDFFIMTPEEFIKISRNGDFISKISLREQECYGIPSAGPDGDIIILGGRGRCQISPEGSVTSNLTFPFSSYGSNVTTDGGFIHIEAAEQRIAKTKEEFFEEVNGAGWAEENWNNWCVDQHPPTPICFQNVQRVIVVKTNSAGNEVWRYIHNNTGRLSQIDPIYEINNDKGYIIFVNYYHENLLDPHHYSFIHLSAEGTLKKIIDLDDLPDISNQSFRQSGERLKSITVRSDTPTIVYIDAEGIPVEKKVMTRDYGHLIQTDYGGFMAFHGQNLTKINSEGEMVWEKEFPNMTSVGYIQQIIQTKEGSYMVLSNIIKTYYQC